MIANIRYKRVNRRLVLSISTAGLLASSLPTDAAETLAPHVVRAEVQALLTSLEAAGCRFQRNGQWYTGAQAHAHLLRKWQEMERQQMAHSTEQFIDRGASRSMVSGEPYRVQCGSAPPQASYDWLMAQLRAMRTAGK